jgi:hypothetical protein
MAKPPKSKVAKVEDVELIPDAWPRFERLVKAAAKMGHRPHAEKEREPAKASPRKRKT